MTPTSDKPIFTFKELKKVLILAGITILIKTCNLFALKVFAILINSLSVFKNPFNISNTVTIKEMARPIVIMAPHSCAYPNDNNWPEVLLLEDYLILLKMVLILLPKN